MVRIQKAFSPSHLILIDLPTLLAFAVGGRPSEWKMVEAEEDKPLGPGNFRHSYDLKRNGTLITVAVGQDLKPLMLCSRRMSCNFVEQGRWVETWVDLKEENLAREKKGLPPLRNDQYWAHPEGVDHQPLDPSLRQPGVQVHSNPKRSPLVKVQATTEVRPRNTANDLKDVEVLVEGVKKNPSSEPITQYEGKIFVKAQDGSKTQAGKIELYLFEPRKAHGDLFSWADGETEELGRVILQLFQGQAEFCEAISEAFHLRSSSFLLVDHISLEESFRSKGIGTRAMEAVFAAFAKRCSAVVVDKLLVEDDDPEIRKGARRVRQFFERLGFRWISSSFLLCAPKMKEPISFEKAEEVREEVEEGEDGADGYFEDEDDEFDEDEEGEFDEDEDE